MDNIPTKGTFSHFKARLGEGLYNEIFHILFSHRVVIFRQIEGLILKIDVKDASLSQNQIHTAMLFGVKEQLDKQGLCLEIIQSKIFEVAPGIRNLDKTYDIGSCEHLNKTCGYTTHSSIEAHPRLLKEIPRGTSRYNDIKRCCRDGILAPIATIALPLLSKYRCCS